MKKQRLAILVIAIALAIIAVIWATNQSKNVSTADSLYIKEWAVELPLTSTIADAYYTYDTSNDEVFISTKRLDNLLSHIQGCTSGLHGIYYKKTTVDPLTLTEQPSIEPACIVSANSETEQIGNIQADIEAAAQVATLK